MPDVSRVVLGMRMQALMDIEDEEEPSICLTDDEDMALVALRFTEVDFVGSTDEALYYYAVDMANESVEEIYESLLRSRDLLREAREEADILEVCLNQEPNWVV